MINGENRYCLRCKYLNCIRENPFTEEADYFFCHIVCLTFTRSQAGGMVCGYYKKRDES